MDNFFENHIIIGSDQEITHEEELEICDLAQQVLRRRNESRRVKLITGFEEKEL